MKIMLCEKCNRVKIEDQEWSEYPSKKITKKAENVILKDECDYCSDKLVREDDIEEPSEEIISVNSEEESNTDLTKNKTEEAHKNHSHIVECKKLMGDALMDFADALKESRLNGYYKFYNDSWEAYLSDADIGIDSSRARRLILLSKSRVAMERELGTKIDFNEISEGRLCRDILHCIDYDGNSDKVKNTNDIEDLLDKAKTLGHEDFRAECDEYKSRRGDKNKKEIPEKRIKEGPIKNKEGTIIGYITSCYANSKYHNMRIRIDNDCIEDGKMEIVIE